jgi:hypothetical protein
MNIQTVADNLRNTIAGKEQLLKRYQSLPQVDVEGLVICQMLTVNIGELKRILQDVEQCKDRYQEGYEDGESAGWEQAILKERG